jgi:8-oxo-dGTP pyrophosphatase MutT (NUDIX family)
VAGDRFVSRGAGTPEDPVLAAGGVIWRKPSSDSEVEVVLVHRPRYDDWSLPKGKLDEGETDEQAALREVEEEAGVIATLGPELPPTTYLDRSGKHKRVRYWAMTVVSGQPTGANEVDHAAWVPISEATGRLSYSHDVEVVNALLNALG